MSSKKFHRPRPVCTHRIFPFLDFSRSTDYDFPPLSDEETQGRTDSIPADADAFALENPDVLITYDISKVLDSRLFPDTSLGIPGNLMFWGGWPAKSPSLRYQLQQYGLDPNHLTARDLLGENVAYETDGDE